MFASWQKINFQPPFGRPHEGFLFSSPFFGATKKFIESSTKIFQYVTFLLVVETLSVIPVVQSPWTGTWQVLKCGHYQKVQLWVQQ